MEVGNKKSDNFTENKMFYCVLFLLGLITIMLRNADMFAQNMLYTEDGTWLGNIYTKGFFHTLINAKDDYFVFGNIILLKISDIFNYILYGDDISRIPMFIAFTQYLFYICLAILPVVCFRKRLNLTARVMMYIFIVLLPFGKVAGFYEIPGRISNIGYIVYPMAFCLSVYRLDYKNEFSLKKLFAIDFCLFILACTNPACYALIPIFFIFDLIDEINKNKETFKSNQNMKMLDYILDIFKPNYMRSWFILGTAMFFALLYCTLFLPSSDTQLSTYVEGTFTIYTAVEFLAHSFLYPFIFPLYELLNFKIALILLVVFWTYVIFCVVTIKDSKTKRFAYMVIGFTWIYVISTMVSRDGLYALFQDYKNIFPERYFYSQNIMSLFVFFTALLSWDNKKIRKILFVIVCIPLLIGYAISIKYLFYCNGTIDVSKTFYNRVTIAQFAEGEDFVNVPIEFTGWNITVPKNKYFATIDRQRKETPFVLSNMTDANWTNGTSTVANILLFPNEGKYTVFLTNNHPSKITVGDYSANIIRIENTGAYFWVYIDENADKTRFEFPNEVKFE